jgi:hypothetical protein
VYCRLEHRCPARFFPANQLDQLVWQDLCTVLTHPEMITAALQRAQAGSWLPQELQARRDNLRKGQNALQSQLDRLTEAYLNGVIHLPEYQRMRSELEKRQQGLVEQEKQLWNQERKQEELAGWNASIETFCQRVQTGLDQAAFEQQRKQVELLIDRVIVTDENVEIRYVIPTSQESENTRFLSFAERLFRWPISKGTSDIDLPVPPFPDRSRITTLGVGNAGCHPVAAPSRLKRTVFFEVQSLPGLNRHRLFAQQESFRPIWCSGGFGELELRPMFGCCPLLAFHVRLGTLIKHQVAA